MRRRPLVKTLDQYFPEKEDVVGKHDGPNGQTLGWRSYSLFMPIQMFHCPYNKSCHNFYFFVQCRPLSYLAPWNNVCPLTWTEYLDLGTKFRKEGRKGEKRKKRRRPRPFSDGRRPLLRVTVKAGAAGISYFYAGKSLLTAERDCQGQQT